MENVSQKSWRFPLSVPKQKWKRSIVVFLGNGYLLFNPRLKKRLKSGIHPKNKVERWALASIVHGLEKDNNSEALKLIHRKLWENGEAFHFYKKTEGRLDRILEQFHERFDEFVREQVELGISKRMIEIGCGTGKILAHFSTKHPEFDSFVGLDINEAQIKENQVNFAGNPKMKFFSGDANQWIKENCEKGTIYFAVGGVLEYFTEKEVRDILELIKTTESALMIFEPIKGDVDPFKVGTSQPFGSELSFSHPYAYLAESSGLKVELSEKIEFINTTWIIMFATSQL